MELNTTAQITRKRIISAVFTYILKKGREATASTKLDRSQWDGKMMGGICMLSVWVLKLVRIIHTKGKIMMMAPRMRKK